MRVIGTAGHVDHGKSSLLRALTGMEPSRLAEERRRGMTMQLGYVWMPGADGESIGIVDVPGHADYRTAMMTGISTLDAFLFVCAADDGWMPQSEEHLTVLRAFAVRHGVVVLTKSDLVPSARLAELKAELEVRFFAAFEREFPIVAFAAPGGVGLEEVRTATLAELATMPELPSDRAVPVVSRQARMHVDRVFTLTGQGTVVTGTLRGGSLRQRDELEVLGSGRRGVIRTLQSYGQTVAEARPNARVALQIAGLTPEEVGRDDQLALSGRFRLTDRLDVRMEPVAGFAPKARRKTTVLLVHGGVRTRAEMQVIGEPEGDRGRDAVLARLTLSRPRELIFGERLVLVSSGGDRLLAAGRVLDQDPGGPLTRAAVHLESVRDFSWPEFLAMNITKRGWIEASAAALVTPFADEDRALTDLTGTAEFTAFGDWISTPALVIEWETAITTRIEAHHRLFPEDEGVADTRLIKALRLPDGLLRALVRRLKDRGVLVQAGPYLKRPAHTPRVDQASVLGRKLEECAACERAVAWSHFELGVDSEAKKRVLGRYIADGRLVRIGAEHVMAARIYQDLSARVLDTLRVSGPQSAAALRDTLGIGRKIVIMLLETMDAQQLTYRDGELRRLTRAASLPGGGERCL